MSGADLKTRLIFLDTNTYISKNFQFESHALEKLRLYMESEDLRLLITDVNISEIKKHIRSRCDEASKVIKEATKSAMILRNAKKLPWAGIFEKLDNDQLYNEITSQFEGFIDSPNVELVKVDIADVGIIFNDYFKGEPPFDTLGKKSEFPDAFILSAINTLSSKRGHKLYVVSNDGDFQRYCARHENLISLATVDELIDIVVRNSDLLAEPAKFADKVYESLEAEIIEGLQAALATADLDPNDDLRGEVEISKIDIDEIGILSKNILEVSREHVVYELRLKLKLTIKYIVTDYDRSPWDSEDKGYLFYLYNEIFKSYTYNPEVTVKIFYEDAIAEDAVVEEIETRGLYDFSGAKSELISYRELDLSDSEEIEADVYDPAAEVGNKPVEGEF